MCFSISCEIFGWLNIAKYQALVIFYRTHDGAVEWLVGEDKNFSWEGAQIKGEMHKRKFTKEMFLRSDFLTSLIYSLKQLCLTIRKIALQVNGVKI